MGWGMYFGDFILPGISMQTAFGGIRRVCDGLV